MYHIDSACFEITTIFHEEPNNNSHYSNRDHDNDETDEYAYKLSIVNCEKYQSKSKTKAKNIFGMLSSIE